MTSSAGVQGGILTAGAQGVVISCRPADGTKRTSVGAVSTSSGAGAAGAVRGRIVSVISMISIISTISVAADNSSTTGDETGNDLTPVEGKVEGRYEGIDMPGSKSETAQSWSP